MAKCITVKQPWASLIVEGLKIGDEIIFKDIENRSWRTSFRGRVLIHAAAKSWTWQKFIQYLYNVVPSIYKVFPETKTWLENLPTGAIIGSVEIVDCVEESKSIWAETVSINKYIDGNLEGTKSMQHWALANPIKFDKPIPCKGKLSFWDYPNILAEPEEKGGKLFCHCQIPVNEEDQVTGDSRFGYYCRYCGGRWYK